MDSTTLDSNAVLPVQDPLEVVIITGISGSGKSVALHALEDAGYFCVDNLPAELLESCVGLEHSRQTPKVAIAADIRTVRSLPLLLPAMTRLKASGLEVKSIFLDASTDTLVRRFSETRRRHPLTDQVTNDETLLDAPTQPVLIEAIEKEREMVSELRQHSSVIDTSELRPSQLRSWIKQVVQAPPSSLTLVFESFAFKHGVPLDADYVFDVRMLPNPYYIPELRPQTGRDQGVADYLSQQPEVAEMIVQIEAFLRRWLPAFEQDQRSYLTVAIGCTGGQHRSVYCVEQLSKRFRLHSAPLIRHRELSAKAN